MQAAQLKTAKNKNNKNKAALHSYYITPRIKINLFRHHLF